MLRFRPEAVHVATPLLVAAAAGVLLLLTWRTARRRPAPSPSTTPLELEHRRLLSPLPSVLIAIAETETSESSLSPDRSSSGSFTSGSARKLKRGSLSAGSGRKSLSRTASPLVQLRRSFVKDAAAQDVPVPLVLWIEYRLWVDRVITARAGRAEHFHSFVYIHTLGLPNGSSLKATWSGEDAADLLACLAEAGLLDSGDVPIPARQALVLWLERSLAAFDGIFTKAKSRGYEGLSREVRDTSQNHPTSHTPPKPVDYTRRAPPTHSPFFSYDSPPRNAPGAAGRRRVERRV